MKNSALRASEFPFYYGWLILAAAAVPEMLAQGATSYAAGLFVLPLQAEFHISRANANSPILILFFGVALGAPFVGKLIDRFSIRLVMPLGAAIFSLSLIAIASSASLWVMALILVLPGAIGFIAIGPLTTTAMAARWFYRRRGLALGLAAVATSGGGFIVVPMLSRAIQSHGWRLGLTYEAIAMAVIIIGLALLVLRDSPSKAGLGEHPENRGRPAATLYSQSQGIDIRPALTWKEILASRAFWIPSLVLATISGTSQALIVTLVPYAIGSGIAVPSAAMLISAFAISSTLTKIAAGILADHVSQRLLLITAALFMTLSWLILTLFADYWALFASSCTGGVALGCALPTAAALIAARFGSARFGTVMGWTYTLIAAFAILATRYIGVMYDHFGGYHYAFMIFSLILACLLVGTLVVAPERRTA